MTATEADAKTIDAIWARYDEAMHLAQGQRDRGDVAGYHRVAQLAWTLCDAELRGEVL